MADYRNSYGERISALETWQRSHDRWSVDVEQKLNSRIDDLGRELEKRLERVETKITWFVGVAAGISGLSALVMAIFQLFLTWRR